METIKNNDPPNLVPENGKILRRYRREVPHKLTRDEVHDYGQRLAKREREWDQLDNKRKNIAAQYKGQMSEVGADIDRLTAAIDSGEELRNAEMVDVLIGSQVFSKRADTGELIEQKAASYADTQEDMFPKLEDGPTGDEMLPGDVTETDKAEAAEHEETAAVEGGLVTSSSGDEVFHQPDDPGEANELDADLDAANENTAVVADKPAKKRGGGKKKAK